MSRDYVEYRGALDALGMIERHAVRDACAAIVPEHGETLEAEVPHDLDLIERHRAFRVFDVGCAALDFAAIAVATQICSDDGVVAREVTRDRGPRHAALRCAVQQQHRWAAAADHGMYHGARRADLLGLESREELRIDGARLFVGLRDARRRGG